jgi:hypothetical protein
MISSKSAYFPDGFFRYAQCILGARRMRDENFIRFHIAAAIFESIRT